MRKEIYIWIIALLIPAWKDLHAQDFTADITNGCVPSSIKFTVNNYSAGSVFSWDFGSGYTAPAASDSVKYNLYKATGSFQVSLKIILNGNTKVITKSSYITISTAPQIQVSWNKFFVCDMTQSVTFTDSTKNVTQRDWIIDGTNIQNNAYKVTYTFTSPGVKSLVLKVKSSVGCVAIYSRDTAVIVLNKPNLTIDTLSTRGCAPFKTKVGLQSQSSLQNIVSYSWKMTGALVDTSSATEPDVTYQNKGFYSINLTIKTTQGCTYKINVDSMIQVVNKPVLSFKADDSIYCNSNIISLVNKTSQPGAGLFAWNLPSGATISLNNKDSAKFQLNNHGQFDIGLSYNFGSCQVDTVLKKVIKVRQAVASIYIPEKSFCATPALVYFSDSGTVVDNNGKYDIVWRLFNSSNQLLYSTDSNSFTYTLTQTGKYSVSLKLIAKNGCTDSIYIKNAITLDKPYPKFSVNPTVPCPNALSTIQDATPVYNPSYVNNFYRWRLYDRDFTTLIAVDTNKSFKYFFTDTGYYKVVLTVFNSQGCIDSLIDTTKLYVSGISHSMDAIKNHICNGDSSIYKITLYPSTARATYNWEFINQTTLDTLRYNKTTRTGFPAGAAGTYTVVSYAYTNGGCTSVVSKPSYLFVSGVKYAALADSFIQCSPPRFHLKSEYIFNTPLGSDTTVKTRWFSDNSCVIFDDTTTSDTYVSLTAKGCYRIGFEAENVDGCKITFDTLINECFGQSLSISTDTAICLGDTITLYNNSTTAQTGNWFISGNTSDYTLFGSNATASPDILFRKEGDYFVKYVGLSPRGCPDSTEVKVVVSKMKASIYSADSVAFCGPTIVNIQYTGTPATSFLWDFGDGSPQYASSQNSISHLYDIKDGKNTFTVKLKVSNDIGCSDEISKTNFIYLEGPIPFFTPKNTSGCDPLTVEFENKTRGASVMYFYDDKGNIDSSGNSSLFITYNVKSTGDSISEYYPYMIGIDSTQTCLKAYSLKTPITVYKKPMADFTFSDTVACRNQTLKFNDVSTDGITRQWDFDGDGTIDDTARTAYHTYTQAGKYYPVMVSFNQGNCPDTLRATVPVTVSPPLDITIHADKYRVCPGEAVHIFPVYDSIINKNVNFTWKVLLNGEEKASSKLKEFDFNSIISGKYQVILNYTAFNQCPDSLVIDPLFIIVANYTPEGSKINRVTVEKDSAVRISWTVCKPEYFTEYRLMRTAPGKPELLYISQNINDTEFVDLRYNSLYSVEYSYRIIAIEKCKSPKIYTDHSNMVLTSKILSANSVELKWTPYFPWMGEVNYEVYRKNRNGNFSLIATTPQTLYNDKKVCDSDYIYLIKATHTDGLISSSNTVIVHPVFSKLGDPAHVKSVSITEDDRTQITFDTTSLRYRTAAYQIYSTVDPYKGWTLETETLNDKVILHRNTNIIARYMVIRRDMCGYEGTPGLFGNNIVLNARLDNDSAVLTWNQYRQTQAGVKEYLIYKLNRELGKYILIGTNKSKDTVFVDGVISDMHYDKFTYMIGAVTNDYKTDTSYSSRAYTVYPSTFFMPNSFTPNGDDLNEVFRPEISFVYGSHPLESMEYRFTIYNRWGVLIYETHDPRQGWDGKINGQPAPADMYIFNLNATAFKDKFQYIKEGTFILLR